MTLRFEVDYYDSSEKTLIAATSYGSTAAALVDGGLALDEEEFLTYSLFTYWRNVNGWRTFKEWKQRLPSAVGMFENYIDISAGTARATFSSQNPPDIVERAGVGASLATANRLFPPLHEADWEKIPETTANKTLDFTHPLPLTASTGQHFVQVEAKGAVVDGNPALKLGSVSNHRGSIKEKKVAARAKNSPDVLVGTIAAFSVAPGTPARVWLLDPPPEVPEISPRMYRLLARLFFYLRVCSVVSSTSMLNALRERLRALAILPDPSVLDGVRLVSLAGNRYYFDRRVARGKTDVGRRGHPIFGRAVPIDARRIYFSGVDIDVFNVVARQKFDEILAFESREHSAKARLVSTTAIVDVEDAERAGIPYDTTMLDKRERHVHLPVKGNVWIGRSGVATGRMEIIERGA